jgi:MFS family permease
LTLLNVSLINLLTFSMSGERLGAATGLNTIFRNLGATIAPTVAGTILTNYSTYVYFHTPHGPVYFSVPSRDAYVINIDIAMFISALVPILIAKEVLVKRYNT